MRRHLLLGPVVIAAGCHQTFGIEMVDDAETCVGGNGAFGAGLFEACVPTSALPERLDTASGMIDTETDCTRIVAQQDTSATEACIVAATNVTISSEVRVVGPRPLVLVAVEVLAITGTLAAHSSVADGAGPGGSYPECDGAAGRNDGNGGGGGGAGGTFGTIGGNGADHTSGGDGGTAVAASSSPAFLRGGCAGGAGGDSSAGPEGGAAGAGGGGVHLVAGIEIVVNGRINASGAAGGGGTADSSGRGTGGGGGGSGGTIGLDAPAITIGAGAILIANGGGGGGGGGTTSAGGPGGEPDLGQPPNVAMGGLGGAGAGGNGATSAVAAGDGALSGGGGGGGVGFILLYSPVPLVDATAWLSPLPNET